MLERSALVVLLLAPLSAQTPLEFSSRHPRGGIPDFGGWTRAVVAGDFDLDGDADVILGRSQDLDGRTVRWLANDGNAGFEDRPSTLLPSPQPTDVHVIHAVDVDADGDLDLVLAGGGDFGFGERLYLNDGLGAFTDAGGLPLRSERTTTIASGDVDGDGDMDLLLGSAFENNPPFGSSAQQTRLWLNDGAGVFSDATSSNLPNAVYRTEDVLLFDVDGDGDLDAFLANSPPAQSPFGPDFGQDRLWINDGSGQFVDETASRLPVESGHASDAAVLDVDADGDLDLFVTGLFTNSAATLWINDGLGGFVDETAARTPGLNGASSIAVGDFDQDGRDDLVFVARSSVWLQDATGSFAQSTLPENVDVVTAVVVADVDGNGRDDLVAGGRRVNGADWVRDRVYVQRGGAAEFDFLPRPDLRANGVVANGVAAGDVNSDGHVDLVLGSFFTACELWLGDGDAEFVEVPNPGFPTLVGATRDVELVDVDADGHLDVWIVNSDNVDTQDRLLLGDGAGNFVDVTATHLPVLLDETFVVEFGDVDGDGDLDAFTGLGQSVLRANRLLLNDGTGRFSEAVGAIPPILGRTRDAEFVDLDGDSDLDLVWAGPDENAILINDGSGTFVDETAIRYPPVSLMTGRAVCASDVDADGDMDLFFIHAFGDRLFLNDGTGMFSDVSTTHLPGTPVAETACFADLDLDGDPDLVLGFDGAFVWYNDGNGVFTDGSSGVLVDDADVFSLAVADVDSDGDPDVVLGRSMAQNSPTVAGAHRVLLNRMRDWEASNLPRAGVDYRLTARIHGVGTGGLVAPLLAFAPLEPRASLFDLGRLGIDPVTLVALPPLVTDVDGVAAMDLAISTVPGALGLELWTQAVLLPTLQIEDARLSNRQVGVVR